MKKLQPAGFTPRTAAILLFAMIVLNYVATAQERDVPYVPTPYDVVEVMLDAVDPGPGDYVIDLGSGDGRIVIAAALRGATGHGIDIDPARIREANQNAQGSGVEDRVMFVQENIFETDFSQANIITMYLLNSVNMKLRPKLLETLRPGTQIVSHSFSMNDWKPDSLIKTGNREIYYWVVPAKINGDWQWKTGGKNFNMTAQQKFQDVKLMISDGKEEYTIEDPILSGERLSFKAVNPKNGTFLYYSGCIDEDNISGMVQVHNGDKSSVEKWSASKSPGRASK